MQNRFRSWALWLAIASLVIFVVLNTTGIDISEPVNTIMNLALPVLVAFGVINDPTVRARLFGEGDQRWYHSWAVWLAIAALITYCIKYFFHLDMEQTISGLMDVLLPVLVAFGIVNNPTQHSAL
jgi:uncharacterized membrane protein